MRLHVRVAWPMAALATRVFGLLFPAGDTFEMRVLVKSEPDVRMAGFTYSAAGESLRWRLRLRAYGQTGQEQPEFRRAMRVRGSHACSLWL